MDDRLLSSKIDLILKERDGLFAQMDLKMVVYVRYHQVTSPIGPYLLPDLYSPGSLYPYEYIKRTGYVWFSSEKLPILALAL